jgi:hypothetical protein
MKKKSKIYDQVLGAFNRGPVEVLRLKFDTDGDWAPMAPDDMSIKEHGGKYHIVWGSDVEGPFESLQEALATEYFNVPVPGANLSSEVLPHEQVLKIAYAIADWDDLEERGINDLRVNKKRYKVANRRLILIKESNPHLAERLAIQARSNEANRFAKSVKKQLRAAMEKKPKGR